MAKEPPPEHLEGEPTRVTLAAGTPVFRVHSSKRSPVAFNPKPAHAFYYGGRFDGTPYDPYGFLYVGFGVGAALCESLLRSLPFDGDGGARLVPQPQVAGRRLSFLELAVDVEAVSLMYGTDLAAVAQTTWLVHAEGADYPQTRDWGHWIRRQTKLWSQAFVWPSKREPADRVAVLFGDRFDEAPLAPTGQTPIDFDTEEGLRWLNNALSAYRTQVGPRPQEGGLL